MATGSFRYPFDIQSTMEPWRHTLGSQFDDVVAHLSDRDRALEDYVSRLPQGILPGGYAQVTANQGSITSAVALSGLSATVTVPAGRTLRIVGKCLPSSTVGGDAADLYLMEDGAQVNFSREALNQASNGFDIEVVGIRSPAAGTHTYSLQMGRQGTGTVTNNAASANPSFITVEDLGPLT